MSAKEIDMTAEADKFRVTEGGWIGVPDGTIYYRSYSRLRVGDRVRHGDVVGVIDDVLLTVGVVRFGIRADDGRGYFAWGPRLIRERPAMSLVGADRPQA